MYNKLPYVQLKFKLIQKNKQKKKICSARVNFDAFVLVYQLDYYSTRVHLFCFR